MRSVAMRSASIHNTSGRYWDGTVCQNTVASSLVYALLWPPILASSDACSSGSTFLDPLNIMCSNRWAKPVRPGFSSLDPTWYHTSTCTMGVEWSGDSTTVSPFGSVMSSYCNRGGRTAASTGDNISTAHNVTALSSFFGERENILCIEVLIGS